MAPKCPMAPKEVIVNPYVGTALFLENKIYIIEFKLDKVENAMKQYGILPNMSEFFLFELKNEIFTFSSKDSDKFKKPKINSILAYVIVLLLIEINNGIIRGIPNDKMINYYIFEKIGLNIFG